MSYKDRAKSRGDASAVPKSVRDPGAPTKPRPGRLASLDAFRGFIMIMLAAGGFGIARFASLPEDAPVWKQCDFEWWQWLQFHFEHPEWKSISGDITVSFWDLIQPAFMFMVGVAMPFSYAKRERKGQKGLGRFVHAFVRAVVLVLLGVFLYSLGKERTNWIFTNVLAQIGLGYFFVYLLLGRRFGTHLCALAIILLGYFFFFYANVPPAGFDYAAVNAKADRDEIFDGQFAAWSKNANAASDFDLWLLNELRTPAAKLAEPNDVDGDADNDDADEQTEGEPVAEVPVEVSVMRRWFFANSEPFKFNGGGYTTLNFVPSIGTMLLGLMCGQLLMSRRNKWANLAILLAAGAICLVDGVLMDWFMCPIVKRIWTPSWTMFSGGWVIWMLAAFYFVFDILPLKKLAFPLVVVGMNSIVMYMMGQLIRSWVTDNIVKTHFTGVLESMFGAEALADDMFGRLIYPTAAFVVFWLIAFWMYRKRLFVRI
jgi:heparan-alpha-glucosaminide N-acetyltransferase